MATKKQKTEQEVSVEDKLDSLYKLQSYLSEIDRIKTLRGELPLEVALAQELTITNLKLNSLRIILKYRKVKLKPVKLRLKSIISSSIT
jgi:hypothetical protein